ncbi:hypothetical protein BN946_scf184801.g57 [Trametes cinnabarina]|uniref:Phospholipase n=1 Tax=Pycnoporus cinnabarinus TaxID=5643 RepID=A0A060SF53_PYCCI|nr:hypothetical protein BN946_scf184801.g57 [Trametes cinnabarina]
MVSLARPPDGLRDVVKHAIVNHARDRRADKEEEHPSTPPLAQPPLENVQKYSGSREEHHEDTLPSPEDDGEGSNEKAPLYKLPSVKKKAERKQSHHTVDQPFSPTSPSSKTHFSTVKPSLDQSQRRPPRGLSISTTHGHISQPGTPQQRTGPPRSISYNYSLSSAHGHGISPSTSRHHEGHTQVEDDPDLTFHFPPTSSPFRGALEYGTPELREREREIAERKHKRKDSYFPETWNPIKWITESPRGSPKPEETHFPFHRSRTDVGHRSQDSEGEPEPSHSTSPQSPTAAHRLRQSRSMPHIDNEARSPAAPKWNRLRSLIPHIAGQAKAQTQAPSAVVPPNVNITDELITGGLATLMLRLWFERDERDHRRVPALFHRLRIRVSDSLNPLHGNKAVFRIECEYANGTVRWVVYRQLREFLSLHGHYTLSNAYNRNIETLPEFPLTSLPYFKFLKERGTDVGRADFARLQREALETYLIGLIRAVMFQPSVNRLAGFLELGALTIALAQSGGSQYKAGFLRLEAVAPKGLFGRRAASWREKKKQRWCAVRESYMVAMEEMGELTVWDVFLIDQDFKIERPTRYYRQGLNLFHQLEDHDSDNEYEVKRGQGREKAKGEHQPQQRKRLASTVGSIKSSLSKVLHLGHHHHENHGHVGHEEHSASVNNLGDSPAIRRRRSGSSSSESSEESAPTSRPQSAMLDPSTNTDPLEGGQHEDDHVREEDLQPPSEDPAAQRKKKGSKDVSKHTFYIVNSQTRLKLYAKNERQMLQWISAMERVARESHYTGKNRFDSFAPIRLNVAAQWLVDGRDYFWNLSRAILLARETIQIHDWWLSPELQLRRPNKDRYRLDKLLEKKAKEGVKIYIILYQEVSNRTTPTDSNYAKQRLTALHPNIMVQRSPSHFQTGTFYWAHHEKLCVIDQTIAFMGGLDHCFGRWDTPQHVLVDDPEPGPDGPEYIWPGKDYSNPRILDFHALNKPHEDMYDRSKIPRMPWHDVSMQVVGQPARDLARHFVQRWNYLLRIKNHSRAMPFLLPPPEFKPGELAEMGLTGTCELQICRSAGPWSMGTPDRIEYSIQNAYLKAIQMSDHFVYIENQFFITSTVVNEVKIENRIGDALVHRIIRAHREGTPWKCCIVIPLLPGFAFPVDHSDASAIRIILECQNRTICRGPNSIFARLRKEGIDPDDYISVFSLRNWGKLRGEVLTTEQVYIHGKVCIVDDRLAIIGSANINERSQRGDRDSEIAAVIRDTDMLDCTMAGKPYKVGRFAHSLRVRLMREHLGVDVDALYEEDLMAAEPSKEAYEQEQWDPEGEQEFGAESGVTHIGKHEQRTALGSLMHDTIDGLEQAIHGTAEAGSIDMSALMRKAGFKSKGADATAGDRFLREEREMYKRNGEKETGFPSAVVPTLEEKVVSENRTVQEHAGATPPQESLDEHVQGREGNGHANPSDMPNGHSDKSPNGSATTPNGNPSYPEPPQAPPVAEFCQERYRRGGKSSTGRSGYPAEASCSEAWDKQWQLPTPTPHVDPYGFEDPICDAFWKDVWVASAVHNTEIFRKVFHAIPDDLVTTWKQYKEFIVHHERLNQPLKEQDPADPPLARMPSEAADHDAPGQARIAKQGAYASEDNLAREKEPADDNEAGAGPKEKEKEKQRSTAKGPKPFTQAEREEMESLLHELRGHLVLYPTRFLEGEDLANNFLFPSDRLMPLPIYD